MSANRLQRWAIFLSGYDYEIQFVWSKDNCNADGLSHIPIPKIRSKLTNDKEKQNNYSYLNYVNNNVPCLNSFDVKRESEKDLVENQVIEYCVNG